ncbi:TonB-dependent receptor domain-containing protein [Pseudogemmobacter sonorensis]|uniref:TonB-dependent receptor domain-containing protein n=1 Tax=Pseudogemmobacter sonorensis TaxID=2989681 RepID=UPI0036884655
MNDRGSGVAGRILAAMLMATTVLGGSLMTGSLVMAQEAGYDIPPGAFNTVLAAFGRQSNLQLAYDPALAVGKTSPGLSAPATPDAALTALLQGTGLSFAFTAPGVVTITGLAAGEADTGGIMLGTIVLYGDRTTNVLGESRSSVAVVTGEPAAAPAPTAVRDAFRQMGNVSAGDWLESGFVIRGVNSEGLVPGAAGAPLASLYIDGVQQTVNAVRRGTRSFFDVEQLEVYRGPQSTLSGRAALAGAMYLRTKDPEFARSGEVMLSYGSDNHRRAGVAFGDTLGPNLAYRVSAEWSEKESDLDYRSYRRFDSYDDFITDDYYAIRGKLLWLPTGDDTTRVLLSYARSYDSPTYNDVAGPLWTTGAPGYDARRGDIWGVLTPEPYASMVGQLPAFAEMRDTTVDNFGVEISHNLNGNLRLTALTGISRSVTDRDSINYGTAGEFLQTTGQFTQKTISQEFRLNYDDGVGLKWVTGIYAGRSDNDAWRESMLLSFDQSRNEADITNVALFGEATWEFAPGWSVIGGGRIDWISQKQMAWVASNGTVTADNSSRFEDTVFLPKLGLEYAFAEDQTVSLIYQEGYRPGGSAILAASGTVYDYDAEYAKNLELAWRGSFMDDRLILAANVFWQDWRDQQVEVLVDPSNPSGDSYIANAGKSESHGAELEMSWAASDQLSLFSSVGLLKTKFTDFNLVGYGDYSGLPFPNAPEQSIALGFRWTGTNGFFGAASAKYTGSSMSRLEQGTARPVDLSSYTTVDAEFGYQWNQTRLTAYATNLFDTEYYLYEAGPGVMATLGDRREVGLRLDHRF